jgi:hypothetical protein
LYGRRVRRQYSEQRATGEVVHVEVTPGNVIVVAAWMLDAAACAGMNLGDPRASIAALADLHQLLSQLGIRRSSSGVHHTHLEEQDDQIAQTTPRAPGTADAHVTATVEHGVRISRPSGDKPRRTRQRDCTTGNPAAASSGCSADGS